MERVKLVIKERSERGRSAVRRLRKQGLIPGVLYAAGKQASPFTVEATALRDALSTEAGRHAVLDVTFEGRKRAHVAVVKELQLDKVKNTVSHIDLHEIHLNEPIETKVAVHLEGASKGVKAGGLLEILSHELSVKGLPADIPEHITIDISDVGLGQVVRVKEVVLPVGLAALDEPDTALFHVVPPRGAGVEVEEAEGAVAEQAEPELVGKAREETED